MFYFFFFFFQAEDGIRDFHVTGVQTCALPISLDEGRLLIFAPSALLAAATKEHVGLVLAGIGVWYAVSRGRRRAGALIALSGAAWTAVAVAIVIPHFSPSGGSPLGRRYEAIGGSAGGVARTLTTEPWR